MLLATNGSWTCAVAGRVVSRLRGKRVRSANCIDHQAKSCTPSLRHTNATRLDDALRPASSRGILLAPPRTRNHTPMRRKDKEITDPAELRRILRDARVCRLAVSDGDRPYLVPLTFALDGDDLVLHSACVGRKVDILRRNPQVCFEVEEGVGIAPAATACAFSMRFRTVIGFGEVEFVEDAGERLRLLELFGPRYGAPDAPVPGAENRRTCVLRVRVRELTGKCSLSHLSQRERQACLAVLAGGDVANDGPEVLGAPAPKRQPTLV